MRKYQRMYAADNTFSADQPPLRKHLSFVRLAFAPAGPATAYLRPHGSVAKRRHGTVKRAPLANPLVPKAEASQRVKPSAEPLIHSIAGHVITQRRCSAARTTLHRAAAAPQRCRRFGLAREGGRCTDRASRLTRPEGTWRPRTPHPRNAERNSAPEVLRDPVSATPPPSFGSTPNSAFLGDPRAAQARPAPRRAGPDTACCNCSMECVVDVRATTNPVPLPDNHAQVAWSHLVLRPSASCTPTPNCLSWLSWQSRYPAELEKGAVCAHPLVSVA